MIDKLASFVSKKLAATGGLATLIASIEADPNIKVLGLAILGAAYILVQGRIDATAEDLLPVYLPSSIEQTLVAEPDANPCSDDPALD